MNTEIWVGLLALLGSAGIGSIITKALNRNVDTATAQKLHAETRQAAVNTAASEVETIRAVMTELRGSEQSKISEIAELRADMTLMKSRVEKLEERERHMLTRAAVHEAWDQMAFSLLLATHPNHPPPPPIVPREYFGDDTHEDLLGLLGQLDDLANDRAGQNPPKKEKEDS